MNTPILLITFNRPEHTSKVLSTIRVAKPKDLFVAQDGARKGNLDDQKRCSQVRQVISEMVDWDCNLHTRFSDVNLGCGLGPVAAINWFFENVEYGIILEDDIYPHPLFWDFMENLLVKYKDDMRVGMVCGHNLQRDYYGHASYHFTNTMAGTLGWGTWRRVWSDFRWDIAFDKSDLNNALKQHYNMPKTIRNRTIKYYSQWLAGTRHDCWDYQWDYYLSLNGYLNARANSCLTSHEGNDGCGTHTYNNSNYIMDVNESIFITISHPRTVKIHPEIRLSMYYKELRAIIGTILKRKH